MLEYLLIGAAILILVVVPSVRAGSRRHRQQVARDDPYYVGTDSGGIRWSSSDSPSSVADSGSCSTGDSSSGGDCGGSDSSGGSSD